MYKTGSIIGLSLLIVLLASEKYLSAFFRFAKTENYTCFLNILCVIGR
jgi:hypothetical protein